MCSVIVDGLDLRKCIEVVLFSVYWVRCRVRRCIAHTYTILDQPFVDSFCGMRHKYTATKISLCEDIRERRGMVNMEAEGGEIRQSSCSFGLSTWRSTNLGWSERDMWHHKGRARKRNTEAELGLYSEDCLYSRFLSLSDWMRGGYNGAACDQDNFQQDERSSASGAKTHVYKRPTGTSLTIPARAM